MPSSTYLANAVLDMSLRGIAPTPPEALFVSLHTADPGRTGANEVTTAAWPAYVRMDATAGGAIAAAFDAAAGGASSSNQQMLWPAYDGTDPITITHWAIWDASADGNPLWTGELLADATDPESAPDHKVLNTNDEFVIYPEQLVVELI
jgi:hypothetical protein